MRNTLAREFIELMMQRDGIRRRQLLGISLVVLEWTEELASLLHLAVGGLTVR